MLRHAEGKCSQNRGITFIHIAALSEGERGRKLSPLWVIHSDASGGREVTGTIILAVVEKTVKQPER